MKPIFRYIQNVKKPPLPLTWFILYFSKYASITKYLSEAQILFDYDYQRALYAISRIVNPQTIIETGVCEGYSSYAFLAAIQENGTGGTLHSIDYQTYELPEGKETGWAVPDELRQNWVLINGKSEDYLERVAMENAPIDIFFHDSNHSYEHMMFEFDTVKPFMSGIILSHDISQNPAFREFCNKQKARYNYMYGNLAGARVI